MKTLSLLALSLVLCVCGFDVSFVVPTSTEFVSIGACTISIPRTQRAVLMPSCRLAVPTCGRGVTRISFQFLSDAPQTLLVWQARDYDLELAVTAAGVGTIVQSTGDVDTLQFSVRATPQWQELVVDATAPDTLQVSVNGGRSVRVSVSTLASESDWIYCEIPAGDFEVRSFNELHGAQLVESLSVVPEWECPLTAIDLEGLSWTVTDRGVPAVLSHAAATSVVRVVADSVHLQDCVFARSYERAYIPLTRDLSVIATVCAGSSCESLNLPVLRNEQ